MNPQPKPETYYNQDYLDWIRGQPCLICRQPSVPCHVRRLYWGAGTGKKPHDYVAIQLCPKCHTYSNEREYGTDKQIAENLMRYIESKRKK